MAGYSNTIAQILEDIHKKTNIDCFVETGTFMGTTTKIAQGIFKQVFTIELNERLFQKAQNDLTQDNTHVLQGNSIDVLHKIKEQLTEDTVFYLDAHWAGDLTSRGEKDCPLLEELRLIKERVGKYHDVIIVDDIGWVGKKEEIVFKPEWKSKYFPDGGVFQYDWSDIQLSDIYDMFPDKEAVLVDDRLIIYT